MRQTNLPDLLPKLLAHANGSVHEQWVRCGRPSCRCANGARHGPYHYVFFRTNGQLKKHYLPPQYVALARALCRARRRRQTQVRAELRQGRRQWRTLTDQLRELGG
jgi:hypothetical protein